MENTTPLWLQKLIDWSRENGFQVEESGPVYTIQGAVEGPYWLQANLELDPETGEVFASWTLHHPMLSPAVEEGRCVMYEEDGLVVYEEVEIRSDDPEPYEEGMPIPYLPDPNRL